MLLEELGEGPVADVNVVEVFIALAAPNGLETELFELKFVTTETLTLRLQVLMSSDEPTSRGSTVSLKALADLTWIALPFFDQAQPRASESSYILVSHLFRKKKIGVVIKMKE